MPKVEIPIDNTDSTVSRFVTKSVIEQLMFTFDIPPVKDIIYSQRTKVAPQTQRQKPNEALKLDVNDFIQVDYKESSDADKFDIHQYQFEYPELFQCKRLGISITPMFARKHLTLTLRYDSKSYSNLTSWLHNFERRNILLQPTSTHDIRYNFTIPEAVLAYLNQAYTAQEAVAGYGMSLKTFIEDNFATGCLLIRQNLSGKQNSLAINIKNNNTLGMFTDLPEVQETQVEPPISTLSFTYEVTYERITALILEFQYFIHNQAINLMFLRPFQKRQLENVNPLAGNLTYSQVVNQLTASTYQQPSYQDVTSTLIDGWYPSNTLKSTITKSITPIQLDSTNLYNVIETSLLSTLGYPTWFINLINSCGSIINTLYEFPIYIDLFEVNTNTINIPISVDNTNTIVTADIQLNDIINNNNYIIVNLGVGVNWNSIGVPVGTTAIIGTSFTYNGALITGMGAIVKLQLDLRSRYYLRISVITFLFQVNFKLLQKQPALLLELLQYINPNVTLNIIGNGSYVTNESLRNALNFINNSNYSSPVEALVLNTNILGKSK